MAYRMVPATADGVPLASWLARAGAYIVDWFLLMAVTQIIAMVTPLGAGITRSMNAYIAYLQEVATTGGQLDFAHAVGLLNSPEMTALNVISSVAFIVYSALMLRARGATLGKLLFRLRVVAVGEGRSAPGLATGKAWLRPLVTELIGLLPLLPILDYLFPLWDRRKQTLHDKIVSTQVIREQRPTSGYR